MRRTSATGLGRGENELRRLGILRSSNGGHGDLGRKARDRATRRADNGMIADIQAEKSAPVNPMKELRIEKLVISAYSASRCFVHGGS